MAAYPQYVIDIETKIIQLAKDFLGHNSVGHSMADWQAARALAVEELRKRGVIKD